MTNTEILSSVLRLIPYPRLVTDIDVDSEKNAIKFKWRRKTYRVDDSLRVCSIQHDCLVGCDSSILMETLLNYGQKLLEINYEK